MLLEACISIATNTRTRESWCGLTRARGEGLSAQSVRHKRPDSGGRPLPCAQTRYTRAADAELQAVLGGASQLQHTLEAERAHAIAGCVDVALGQHVVFPGQ